jgi:hypothetical protein
MRFMLVRRAMFGLLAAIAWGLAGCATTGDPDAESDIPWNRQESWEGQLLMPGSMMPGQY